MADNFLERHREEYERCKALWLKRKRLIHPKPKLWRPDDEAL